ncbi:gamma-glutamyl-gamma-aminobutyrate hydrolase family protein [Larkinella rosea]|uniref:Gamma-glutamyl-gamma-aminobutyrate hydrolase family protein n=1 Tax=Larkinella rosea TaxID=2025312 RepID=A0A3P1BC72_9BACT|nr:gamma-glutamyl-gamma-aminobutyrate hydrolase family protein [Larkinella rosea]RRA98604.1 gamma-glutamyl-gamma-aminobutyrate hydrolase family protein [Larkinella rosea]
MKLALTYTGHPHKHVNYCTWLQQHDQTIEIVTLSSENNNLDLLDACSGLVVSGGVDIAPTAYHMDANYAERPEVFEPERDAFETAAFYRAQQRQLPVLGICRGLQLINCILGGTLRQDLAAANVIHKAVVHPQTHRQFDKVHGLHINPDTYLHQLTGHDRAVVNSAHHQCADVIADELMVTCFSDDGVPEGLEWKHKTNRPFLLCVQWHPERMYEFDLQQAPLSLGLRDLFIQQCQ